MSQADDDSLKKLEALMKEDYLSNDNFEKSNYTFNKSLKLNAKNFEDLNKNFHDFRK